MSSSPVRTIYSMLESWAEQTPDSVALLSPGRAALTYRRLLDQVDYVRGCLAASGLCRDDRVAVVVRSGVEMAVTFLGVASNSICVPLNPVYQENEFESYLSDLNARAIILQNAEPSPVVKIARKLGITVIEMAVLTEGVAGVFTLHGLAPCPPATQGCARANDVALMLHTSGTTAKPKKVPLTHENLLVSAQNVKESLDLTSSDRCLNVMPLFHIHGLVGGLLSSLTSGASVVCTTGFDSSRFFSFLDEFQPTWTTAVPAMHQDIVSAARSRAELTRQSSLRFIRSCSASLQPSLLREIEEMFQVPVVEAYGMTEAAHQIASNPLPPRRRKPGSVGVSTGTGIAILSDQGELMPRGEVGEIAIRGANVMSAYADAPATSTPTVLCGWFRTGDRGFLDEAGYLFITGRLKDIINRGGEKISPLEVENALLEYPPVFEAAVFSVPHASLGEDVAAAVALQEGSDATETLMREYLFSRLADFKVPTRIWIVDAIPKSATGKVQRKELSEKLVAQEKLKVDESANELETAVAAIYSVVLGVDGVGREDNFFALGGDSLRATQVRSRILATFQVNLSIATIFLRSTVAELASEIAAVFETTDPLSERGLQQSIE